MAGSSGSSLIRPRPSNASGSRYCSPRRRPQCRHASTAQPACPATSVPIGSPTRTACPVTTPGRTGSYVVRRPLTCTMLTTPRPAIWPAKSTVPGPAASTVASGRAARSTPRCPGDQGCGGGSNRRTGRGLPSSGHRYGPAGRTAGAANRNHGRSATLAGPGAGRTAGAANSSVNPCTGRTGSHPDDVARPAADAAGSAARPTPLGRSAAPVPNSTASPIATSNRHRADWFGGAGWAGGFGRHPDETYQVMSWQRGRSPGRAQRP